MKKFPVILFISTLLSACHSESLVNANTYIYEESVKTALENYAAAMQMPRSKLTFNDGSQADNCKAYIQASKSKKIAEDLSNQLAKSEYLLCDALALLGKAKNALPARKPDMIKRIARQLDLRAFPSSRYQTLTLNNHTLDTIAGDKKLDGNTASVDTADWYYAIMLVAVADVNNNGKKDWILWLVDEAKQGNYKAYQTLVAYDVVDNNQPFVATVFP